MRNKAYRCKKIYEARACCTMRGRDWVAGSERRNSTFHYLQIIKKLLYYLYRNENHQFPFFKRKYRRINSIPHR